MFGREHATAIEERAKLLAHMVTLIVHSLETKTYDQFVESFSNPGAEPDALGRSGHELHFQMRITPTYWYDAAVSYSLDDAPCVLLQEAGDDFGVLITAAPNAGITVDAHLPPGQRVERDARAIMRSLHALPGFRSFVEIERSLGIV